jgi:CubicO group peptidase (beta-lactamase class C family)
MDRWLRSALDYVPEWLDYQMRMSKRPGCAIAIAHRGRVILEQAFGHADLAAAEKLTPRHRFRVASQSKSFTAAGVMKLREQKKLKLDDAIGDYVEGLDAGIARATIGQVLSHSAGIVRDGADSGFFLDRRPFPTADEVLADLKGPPIVAPNTRFKYSNHGFALLGILIARITGEPYASFITREIVEAAGLKETTPDMPIPKGTPFATGYSGELPLGRRVALPGRYSTNAIAPAGGFVSTAHDLSLFFNQLSPRAARSVLTPASRREMTRRHWRNMPSSIEGYYGLGIISGTLGNWEWFGHSGGLQGYITRTATLPDQDLTVSVLTNAIDGWAGPWVDGTIDILRAFADNGPPARRVADWTGRWWNMWGTVDLVPMGAKVMVTIPAAWNPLLDGAELAIERRDRGTIKLSGGYGSPGEPVRRVRSKSGRVTELWLGANNLQPEARVAAEMERRYGATARTPARNAAAVRRRRGSDTKRN